MDDETLEKLTLANIKDRKEKLENLPGAKDKKEAKILKRTKNVGPEAN